MMEFFMVLLVVGAIVGPLFIPQGKQDTTWCSDVWEKGDK